MKNIKRILLLLLVVFSSGLAKAQTYTAGINVVSQEQNQWCWCACTKTIMDYYGTVKQQCAITEYVRTKLSSTFGTTNCCTSPGGKCNNPNNLSGNGSIQDALQALGGIQSSELAALSKAQVETELKGGRPFVLAVYWTSGGGHAVTGCVYNKTQNSFTYMDPWQNNGMTTQQFSTSIQGGAGTWKATLVISTPHDNAGTKDAAAIADAVNVYPNPSQGQLTLKTELAVKTINIFNAVGQLVNSYGSVTEKEFSFKLPKAGFYTVQLITEKGTTNKKIVVQ
jgi:hypothetical protein